MLATDFSKPFSIINSTEYLDNFSNYPHLSERFSCPFVSLSKCTSEADLDGVPPYVSVKIEGEEIVGLLDSGASCCILGKGSVQFVVRNNIRYTPVSNIIRTATGDPQCVCGEFMAKVTYRGKTEKILTLIAPGFSLPLYLGITFWKKFDLMPTIVSEKKQVPQDLVVSEQQGPVTDVSQIVSKNVNHGQIQKKPVVPQRSPKSDRTRNFWFRVREDKRKIKSSRLCSVKSGRDDRPYATITISGKKLTGLLDSGASVSCLGSGALDLIEKGNLPTKAINENILTADGTRQRIDCVVKTDVTYNGMTKQIKFYVVPSLTQPLYLGIDFWRVFRIAPAIINEVQLEITPDSNVHELSAEQQTAFESIKAEFPSFSVEGLGKTNLLAHRIDVGEAQPIKQRHYPVSPAIQKLTYQEIDRMISLGVIEESESAWSSPIVLVKKSNGNTRLCLDSRALNSVTIKDAYPMPNIDGIIGRLDATRYISSIDLKDAFWQIPLDDQAKEKTAFSIPGCPLYQFSRMPFGLCNAAQAMCRLMDRVIPNELRESVFVFIDDLLVVSKDFESHMSLLKKVAFHLRRANLTINVEKSRFVMRQVNNLGYIVGDGCIKTDPDKVKAIVDYTAPQNVKQVRRFLGMCGWYRRFIANYSDISVPISNLLKKSESFTWTDEAQNAFVKLKYALVSAPVLANPDFLKLFILQCDASQTGVGCVLYQIGDDGEEHPIAYMSQKLNSAQRNYSVTELECFAAVLGVKKFRAYIEGTRFKVVTDHASLKWLMGQKDLSGRLARWSLKLQAFDFDIEYRKGSANVVPDALSRMFSEEIAISNAGNFVDMDSNGFISDEYEEIKAIVLKDKNRLPDLKVEGRFVYKRLFSGDIVQQSVWRLWIPSSLTETVISNAHDPPTSAHGGFAKTLDRIKRYFYWPRMANQVLEYVRSCDVCKETKAPNTTLRPPMGKQLSVERPFQHLFIDLLGPYPRSKHGNSYLLIVLDQFSKFVFLNTFRQANAQNIVAYLSSVVFGLFGVPESILSDNGVQFVSKHFTGFLRDLSVKHIFTASHSPQANSSERVNRSIIAAIRAYVAEDQREWDLKIDQISSALRSSTHSSTKFTPHYLVFGTHKIDHASAYPLLRQLDCVGEPDIEIVSGADVKRLTTDRVVKNLRKAYQKHEKTYNVRSRVVDYKPGQEVYRRNFAQSSFQNNFNAKLAKKFIKCRIFKKIGTALYELEDLNGKKIPLRYHAKDLKQ